MCNSCASTSFIVAVTLPRISLKVKGRIDNFSIDFGFAQYLKDDMDSANLRGSPLYMVGHLFLLVARLTIVIVRKRSLETQS